jgi:lipoic acid synthetase
MINRLPSWFKQDILDDSAARRMQLLSELKVNTVCLQAKCPNLTSCFRDTRLTFMILGTICTRKCRFCAVNKAGRPLGFDGNEAGRIGKIVELLGLTYVVITSVTRDDLPDGGAASFAKTIASIYAAGKNIKIETLVPDFQGNTQSLQVVLGARPCVLAHNLETVERLYPLVRPQADYARSLSLVAASKKIDPKIITKSSLMLGMGETEGEVISAMEDLRQQGCDILTLGQYLAPSADHYPVKEFIAREQFVEYREQAYALGFKTVSSGPLVRSSYRAEELYGSFSQGVNLCTM